MAFTTISRKALHFKMFYHQQSSLIFDDVSVTSLRCSLNLWITKTFQLLFVKCDENDVTRVRFSFCSIPMRSFTLESMETIMPKCTL